MSPRPPTDPSALPLSGVVADLVPLDDGRLKVTFTRLAGIYYLASDAPARAALLAALEQSRASGNPVALTYAYPAKTINGLG
jgi:hypothetical protein